MLMQNSQNIYVLTSEEDLRDAFSILKILRPHLSFDEFKSLYDIAHQHETYTLVGYKSNNVLSAVMGWRIIHDFVHGRHLYIDDLITLDTMRNKGIGATLLRHAEELALQHNCKSLRLCTGIENKDGMRFYEREGWQARAFAYKKRC